MQKFDKMMQELMAEELSDEWRLYYTISQLRYKYIINKLPEDMTGMKVLDIGESAFVNIFRGLHPEASLTVLGLGEPGQWVKRESGVEYINHNLEKDCDNLPEEEFDLIIFSEVLEHLAVSPRLVFDKLKMMMKKGGRLMITTPNFMSFGNRLKMLLGKSPLEVIRRDLSNPGHFREYSLPELKQYVTDVGLKVLEAELPLYWNDLGNQIKVYCFQSVGPIKLYLFLVPYMFVRNLFGLVFPTLRYAVYMDCKRSLD